MGKVEFMSKLGVWESYGVAWSKRWVVVVEMEDGHLFIHSIWRHRPLAAKEAQRLNALKELTAWAESESVLFRRLMDRATSS